MRISIMIGCFLLLVSGTACAAGENTQTGKAVGTRSKTVEIHFTSYDGFEMFGKLTIPTSRGSHPVVIYVQTAEGMTVDMKRPKGRGETFNYFDLYREKLPEMTLFVGRANNLGNLRDLQRRFLFKNTTNRRKSRAISRQPIETRASVRR